MSKAFTINNKDLFYNIHEFPLLIKSFPVPYKVSIINSIKEFQDLVTTFDFIIIDENVGKQYMQLPLKKGCTVFNVVATEENKCMSTVLKLIDHFIESNISKGSAVIAIGGGIIQDLAACACALFRRGQPFTYLPTTSLGQLDSCVGAKCAINTSKAKNIIGLFSAPREVAIPTFMIKSMPFNEHRAGMSEMLRLCLTASWEAVDFYTRLFPSISFPASIDLETYVQALSVSLSIKKAVVDYDEYEKDVRRSMNYGHTFGHAIEKLTNFAVPHGLGVLVGMHMANTFSLMNGLMEKETYLRVGEAIRMTASGVQLNIEVMKSLKAEDIISQFKFDKKGDGVSVPLILIKTPGDMMFYRHRFDSNSDLINSSIRVSLNEFTIWIDK